MWSVVTRDTSSTSADRGGEAMMVASPVLSSPLTGGETRMRVYLILMKVAKLGQKVVPL